MPFGLRRRPRFPTMRSDFSLEAARGDLLVARVVARARAVPFQMLAERRRSGALTLQGLCDRRWGNEWRSGHVFRHTEVADHRAGVESVAARSGYGHPFQQAARLVSTRCRPGEAPVRRRNSQQSKGILSVSLPDGSRPVLDGCLFCTLAFGIGKGGPPLAGGNIRRRNQLGNSKQSPVNNALLTDPAARMYGSSESDRRSQSLLRASR